MANNNYPAPKNIIIFNIHKKPIMLAASLSIVGKLLQIDKQGISAACTGKIPTYKNHYFRFLPDNVSNDWGQLSKLSLSEFDKLCGNFRPIFKTSSKKKKDIKHIPVITTDYIQKTKYQINIRLGKETIIFNALNNNLIDILKRFDYWGATNKAKTDFQKIAASLIEKAQADKMKIRGF